MYESAEPFFNVNHMNGVHDFWKNIYLQFSWMIPLVLFVLYSVFYPARQMFYTIRSKNHVFNYSEDPLVFSHVTDVHISAYEPLKIVNSRALFKELMFYRTNFTLFTGDLVDSYPKQNWPRIGKQVHKDWLLWKHLLDVEAPGLDYIDIPGNHDLFGIYEPFSRHMNYIDYSNTFTRESIKSMEDFWVRVVNKSGLNFVLVNTYRFPTIHPPYLNWPYPTRKMLDHLESVLTNVGKCYVAVHCPVDNHWSIVKSSSGKSFSQLMKSDNILAIFSGHFHPDHVLIEHHSQYNVEYIGVAAFQFRGFGLCSIDNEQFVYHSIYFDSFRKYIFVTYPVPYDQLSSRHTFNTNEGRIRVIVYGSKNMIIRVSGAVNGDLKFERELGNMVCLYSIDYNLEDGFHRINVYCEGDYNTINTSVLFFIGSNCTNGGEIKPTYSRTIFFARLTLIPVFLSTLYIIFSADIKGALPKTTDHIHPQQFSYLCLHHGLQAMRLRFASLPRKMRLPFIFSFVYPLLFPMHIFEPIEGHIGWSSFIYVVIGRHIYFDDWSTHFLFFYYTFTFFPLLCLASSITLRHVCKPFYLFNIAYVALAMMCISIVNYRWVGESATKFFILFNPCYVLIPLYLLFIIYRSLPADRWYESEK